MTDLYESVYPYYNSYEEERTDFRLQNVNQKFLEYFNMRFRPDLYHYTSSEISVENYVRLREDDAFVRLVHGIEYEHSMVRNRAQQMESKMGELVGLLNEELGILEEHK